MPDKLQPGKPALRRAGHAQGIFNGYLPGAATGEFTVLESETFRDFGKLHRLQAAVISPVPQNHDPGWDVDPNDFLYQPVNVYLEAEACASKLPSGQYLWRWRIVSYTPAVCIAVQQEANPDAPAESWCGRAARAGRLERLSSLRETLQDGALHYPDGPDTDALSWSRLLADRRESPGREINGRTYEAPTFHAGTANRCEATAGSGRRLHLSARDNRFPVWTHTSPPEAVAPEAVAPEA